VGAWSSSSAATGSARASTAEGHDVRGPRETPRLELASELTNYVEALCGSWPLRAPSPAPPRRGLSTQSLREARPKPRVASSRLGSRDPHRLRDDPRHLAQTFAPRSNPARRPDGRANEVSSAGKPVAEPGHS
jgi:hypothetical protein